MIYDKAGEVIEVLFKSLLFRYQIGLKESVEGNNCVFDCVNLYHKCHKLNLNCGGSYTDSLDWIKNKKNNNKSYQWQSVTMINAFSMKQLY